MRSWVWIFRARSITLLGCFLFFLLFLFFFYYWFWLFHLWLFHLRRLLYNFRWCCWWFLLLWCRLLSFWRFGRWFWSFISFCLPVVSSLFLDFCGWRRLWRLGWWRRCCFWLGLLFWRALLNLNGSCRLRRAGSCGRFGFGSSSRLFFL